MKRFFYLLLIISYTKSAGQIPKKTELPDNIEIVLNTDGDLLLSGSSSKAVTTNKAQDIANDNLVKQFSEAKETKLFTTKAEAKKNKKHENLGIDIPDGSSVSLRTQKGNVTINQVNAYLSGHIQSGELTLKGLKGDVELVSEDGNINAKEVEAKGMLIARNGNIQLTDVTGMIATYAPQGKITLTIGADYYKKSPRPLDIGLPEGDIEIAAAPYGGTVRLGKGNLMISDVAQQLTVEGEAANITLRGVAAPLSLRNRGDVSVQFVKFSDKKDEGQNVDIETSDGDVTLELAKNFVGSLVIWTTETNPVGEKSLVTSAVSLEKASIADNGFSDGRVNVRESTRRVIIGKGGPKVSIHVTNGKVFINN